MAKKRNSKNITIWKNNYSITENGRIGGGGNADVYEVIDKNTNQVYALKVLKKRYHEPVLRFRDEIRIMKKCKSISGVLPIVESSSKFLQYVMPIAQPITESFDKKYHNTQEFIESVLTAVIQLSNTLSVIHNLNISHRDIKPQNIYLYNGTYCFGDFGLVSFPNNPNDLTRSDRNLGPIFTIAPEMKRDPKHADGKKADVYSLAKTMWILLTGDEKGFDGVYDYRDKNHGLRHLEKFRGIHLVELEYLLKSATSNDPFERPTIYEFKTQLENYLKILNDFTAAQQSDWVFINKQLFPFGQTSSIWNDVDRIIDVLNLIGSSPAYNHMMFSDGGGLDFKYATLANEEGCIYIYDTSKYCHIVKPKHLISESFKSDYTWNYFLLELDELNSILGSDLEYEELIEDHPANYISSENWQYGVYDYDDGTPLPSDAKLVYRYTKGKILFVLKSGTYNAITGTYDGRHGDCNSDEFKYYIEKLISKTEELTNLGFNKSKIINSKVFNSNPFKKESLKVEEEIKYPDEFIKNNYLNWCFYELIKGYNTNREHCRYYIEFIYKHSFDLLDRSSYYLCDDGFLKKLRKNDENIFCVDNRNLAIDIKKSIETEIIKICNENGYNEPFENLISIVLDRNQFKPSHMFTKSEIENEMKNADDRHNNQLVIDEYGYAHIIRNNIYGHTYPVSLEQWSAKSLYVGKYSKLQTLDDNYKMCLEAWLLYLSTGKHQSKDYVSDTETEEELLENIYSFY